MLQVWTHDLRAILVSEAFALTGCEKTPTGYVLSIERVGPNHPWLSELNAIASGKITLDAEAGYAVKEAILEGVPGSHVLKCEFKNHYVTEPGSPARPVRQEMTVSRESGDESVQVRIEHHAYDVRSPEIFRLTHYGLPEPPRNSFKEPGSYRTSAWLYYFVGGVLTVVVGAFAIHRATKGRT